MNSWENAIIWGGALVVAALVAVLLLVLGPAVTIGLAALAYMGSKFAPRGS